MALIAKQLAKTAEGLSLFRLEKRYDVTDKEGKRADGSTYTTSYSVLEFSGLDKTKKFSLTFKVIGRYNTANPDEYTEAVQALGYDFEAEDSLLTADDALTVDADEIDPENLVETDEVGEGTAIDNFLDACIGKRYWARTHKPSGSKYEKIQPKTLTEVTSK